jgi:hypothetical protein
MEILTGGVEESNLYITTALKSLTPTNEEPTQPIEKPKINKGPLFDKVLRTTYLRTTYYVLRRLNK